MLVRPATLADTDELIRLAAVMFEAVGQDTSDDAWRRSGAEGLKHGFTDGSIGAFVVDHPSIPGRCISAAAASVSRRLPHPIKPDLRVAYVQWVATDPEFRRRGLSRAVVSAIIEWSVAQGVGSVDLHASKDGEPLYRSLGFVTSHNPELRLFL